MFSKGNALYFRESPKETDLLFRYLQYCYDHFKTLSTLLAEHEGKSKGKKFIVLWQLSMFTITTGLVKL